MDYKIQRIENAFRYLATGIYFYIAFWLVNKKQFYKIAEELKPMMLIIAAFVIGTVLYFVYRTLIYPHIFRIIDYLAVRNPRAYLKKQYEISDWAIRHDLWRKFYSLIENVDKNFYEIWAASIHMMNMIWIISLGGCLYLLFIEFQQLPFFILLSILVLLLLSAFISDINLQRRLHTELITTEHDVLDKMVKSLKKEIRI